MDPIALIRSHIESLSKTNPQYSLRAFARSLRMDPGNLSKMLNRKRALSVPVALKIASRLKLEGCDRELFLQQVTAFHPDGKPLSQKSSAVAKGMVERLLIDNDVFNILSSWYHLGILELGGSSGIPKNFSKLAGKFGIMPIQAKEAVSRLCRLGLLALENGLFRKTSHHLATNDDSQTTEALRHLQADLLAKALESVQQDPYDQRVVTAMTFAIDPTLLPVARKKIATFLQMMEQLLETGNKRQVYNLSVALFPLEKARKSQ